MRPAEQYEQPICSVQFPLSLVLIWRRLQRVLRAFWVAQFRLIVTIVVTNEELATHRRREGAMRRRELFYSPKSGRTFKIKFGRHSQEAAW